MVFKLDQLFLRFLFIVLALCFCLLSLSCGGSSLSGRVKIAMHELRPVVHFKKREVVICRRGLPDNFVRPWDAEYIRIGRSDLTEGEAAAEDVEGPQDIITESVEDYWFKVRPLIHNRTQYYLVVTDLKFKVSLQGREPQSTDVEFGDGSYCETDPLYILSPDENISNDQFDRPYAQGNIVFYLGGLPVSEPRAVARTRSQAFDLIRIPQYTVNWHIVGSFYTSVGKRVGTFQRRGKFRTQPSTF